jgi:hypothetical protein
MAAAITVKAAHLISHSSSPEQARLIGKTKHLATISPMAGSNFPRSGTGERMLAELDCGYPAERYGHTFAPGDAYREGAGRAQVVLDRQGY